MISALVCLISMAHSSLSPTFLRCENRVNPLGIDDAKPRFSWKLKAVNPEAKNLSQTAYRVLIASDPKLLSTGKGDVWDSGQVSSSEQFGIEYAGPFLPSGKVCYWSVQTWDEAGAASDWSPPATFSMGLLKPEDWTAKWIAIDAPNGPPVDWKPRIGRVEGPLKLRAATYYRKDFEVAARLKRATAYVTAQGLVDLHVNGRRVTNDLFTPGWTDYNKRIYYRTFDVTRLVKMGKNAVGAILGDGWYSGYIGYGGHRAHYGDRPRVRVQVNLEYADGHVETVGTSSDWQASTGGIVEQDFLMGEAFDARLEPSGWDKAGFSGSWSTPYEVHDVKAAIEAFNGDPVRAYERLKAKTITEPHPGTYVLDFAQNLAGFARIRVNGKPGQKITLRFAEKLNKDGTLYVDNLRSARAEDVYICKDWGVEEWEPRFTFHGFQYAEVRGLTSKPAADDIVAVAISSATPETGTIKTSDPMINRLAKNAWWTQKMNFIDIPTDCPQRDERLGWTGDAQAYIRTASMFSDVQPFFTKWLITLDDGQRADGQFPMVAPVKVAGDDGGPAWADAGVICPWTIYDVYGDRRLLAERYPAMKKFVEFMRKRSTADLLPPEKFHCFGDWVSLNADTPKTVIYEAYFAYSTHLTALAAEALGYGEDAAMYRDLFKKVKAIFNKSYVSADGTVAGDTQCSYVLALSFDLLDEAMANLAAEKLVKRIEERGWHLSTGFVGTRDLMPALTKIGRNDVAYRLLHNKTYPSWGFEIAEGATSIWERWDGYTRDKGFQDPDMNSFAHYAFGGVMSWVFAHVGGIQNITPGFTKIRIAPEIDPHLKWARTKFESVHGLIETDWKVEGGKVTLSVVIPPNTTAEVHIPGTDRIETVGSGRYTFGPS